MRKLLLFFIFFTSTFFAQVKLLSWNVENLGSSKSPSDLLYIVSILKNYDVVALQEVVAGDGGAQAVAKLADELNRKGSKWDYVVSDPTSSSAYKTERYAFLWKTSKVKKVGEAWLEKKYQLEIDREPYYCTFDFKGKQFTIANFHAITKSKQPETEIKYFKFLPEQYPKLNLLFVGDFNCPQSHTVFNPLKKMGYDCVFVSQKTSLKKEIKTLQNNNIKLNAIGNLTNLPDSVQKELLEVINKTAENTRMTLTLALSYGAREELIQAVKKISNKVKN